MFNYWWKITDKHLFGSLKRFVRFVSDDDWGAPAEENDYLPETETTGTSLTLPRLPRSPERLSSQVNRGVSPSCNRSRRAPEFRQRSPSPQYQPRINPCEVSSPRERFQDAKEMFRAMEREAIARPVLSRQRDVESHPVHRYGFKCFFQRIGFLFAFPLNLLYYKIVHKAVILPRINLLTKFKSWLRICIRIIHLF